MLGVWVSAKLQALVYNILPSTIAVFSYTIGSRKLSANERLLLVLLLLWCSNSNKFVTNNSNYIRRLFYSALALTASVDSCAEINSAPSVAN